MTLEPKDKLDTTLTRSVASAAALVRGGERTGGHVRRL